MIASGRIDDPHMVDAGEDRHARPKRRQHAAIGLGVHQLIVGPGDDRYAAFGASECALPVGRRGVVAQQAEGVFAGHGHFRLRNVGESDRRQRLRPVDPEPFEHERRDDARHVGRYPLAWSFVGQVGRRGIAEVRREQHETIECIAQRAPGNAQREPAARRMADQREAGGRAHLAQFAHEIREVVVELAGIGDVAARPEARGRGIDRDRRHAGAGERRRDRHAFRSSWRRSRAPESRFGRARRSPRDRAGRRARFRREPGSGSNRARPRRRSARRLRESRRAAAAGAPARPA